MSEEYEENGFNENEVDLEITGKGLLYLSFLKNNIDIDFDKFDSIWSCFENQCRNACSNEDGYAAIVFSSGLGGIIMSVLADDDEEIDEENDDENFESLE